MTRYHCILQPLKIYTGMWCFKLCVAPISFIYQERVATINSEM